MKTAITLTTIYHPKVIEDYLKNISKYQHKDIEIIIVGDKKTPSGLEEYCSSLKLKYDFLITYLNIEEQIKFLNEFPKFQKYLPFNSFARRNIADLYAYKKNFEIIIRIDDDNFPMEEDFISCHIKNLKKETYLYAISSDNGWYNICEELVDKDSIPFYPRGYLYNKRWINNKVSKKNKTVKVVLNAGLWLGDPDVDAITRLCKPIDAIKYKQSFGDNFVLDKDTWCPINTQNTAYDSDIIPAAFVPPNVGRYDDIWGGYILRKVIDHMNHYVAYGKPLLYQKRNKHNLWDDLEKEVNGNIYSDHLIDTLKDIQLSYSNYKDNYFELAEKLESKLSKNTIIFQGVIDGMKAWIESFKQ